MKNSANSSEKPSISLVEAIPAMGRYASKFGWLWFLIGFGGAIILGWVIFPMLLYSSQPQPINFNHALHLNPDVVDGIEGDTDTERCLYCHEFREDGTFVGIPTLDKCMECHDDPEFPIGETDAEAAFLNNYVADEKEIPWLSYARQPDCVYFSHIAHVQMGEIECATCHGPQAETEVLPEQKTNRITGYPISIWGKNISGFYLNKKPSDRMKMDDCAACHTEKGHEENNACFVCHK
jgi:hypothetical protein